MRNLKETQYKDSSNFNARIYLHQKFSTNKYPWPLWVFDKINKENNAKVLELGCGNGILWKINARRIPRNWNIILSDFSEGMLEAAKKNIRNSIENIQYELINIENIPYDNDTFDIIIANHMLYHIPDKQKALSEIYRILKNNGTFYATTVAKEGMKEMKELVLEYYSISSPEESLVSLFENFSLENGGKQLEVYFKDVLTEIYKNVLNVNEAKPFVDYIISSKDISPGRTVLNENQIFPFTKFIQDKIKRDQFIRISSDFGIFICKKF